jgi:hypothetical protein
MQLLSLAPHLLHKFCQHFWRCKRMLGPHRHFIAVFLAAAAAVTAAATAAAAACACSTSGSGVSMWQLCAVPGTSCLGSTNTNTVQH